MATSVLAPARIRQQELQHLKLWSYDTTCLQIPVACTLIVHCIYTAYSATVRQHHMLTTGAGTAVTNPELAPLKTTNC